MVDIDVNVLRIRFLDYLEREAGGKPLIYVTAKPFAESENLDLEVVFGLVRECVENGTIEDASGFGNPCASITLKGIAEVQARRMRRQPGPERNAALRNGLLKYYYQSEHRGVSHPPLAEFFASGLSLYEGEQFDIHEVDRTAQYLDHHGLIKFNVAHGSLAAMKGEAKVTPQGEDCIEQFDGNVLAYLSRPSGAGPMITTNIGTFNNSGAAAIGSTDVTQNVTSGADAAGFAEFARVLLEGFHGLPFEDDVLKEQVRAALEEIQREAKAESAPGRLKTAVGKFWGYMAKAGQPVITAALMYQAAHHGMPVPPIGS